MPVESSSPRRRRLPDRGVYVVISSVLRPDIPPLEIARQAVAGGAAIVQVREKGMPASELETLCRAVRDVCHARGALFVVNDDPELAVRVDADGVHLGQEDLERIGPARVRTIVGERIVGLSTHSPEQFDAAMALDLVDYASFGPLYPTHAKNYHLGDAEIDALLGRATRPVVLIGGLTRENLPSLVARGCRLAAVIRDVIQADDIAAATRAFREIVESGGDRVRLTVNGKVADEAAGTVESLVLGRGLRPAGVIVEYNGDFLAREAWPATPLRPGDRIELVAMMCGG